MPVQQQQQRIMCNRKIQNIIIFSVSMWYFSVDKNIFQIYPNYLIYNISIWSNLDPTASERMSGNDIFRDKNIVWQVRSVDLCWTTFGREEMWNIDSHKKTHFWETFLVGIHTFGRTSDIPRFIPSWETFCVHSLQFIIILMNCKLIQICGIIVNTKGGSQVFHFILFGWIYGRKK